MAIPISADRTRRGNLRLRVPKVSRSVLLSMLTIAVLLACWAIVTEMSWANELFLPKPQAVWAAFIKTMTKGYGARRCSSISAPACIASSRLSRWPASSAFRSASSWACRATPARCSIR